jgi:hypothetical protein
MKLPFTLRDRPSQANFDKIAAALGEQTFKAPLPLGSGWGNYGGGYEARQLLADRASRRAAGARHEDGRYPDRRT